MLSAGREGGNERGKSAEDEARKGMHMYIQEREEKESKPTPVLRRPTPYLPLRT